MRVNRAENATERKQMKETLNNKSKCMLESRQATQQFRQQERERSI
jgi:hypothetical protein